MTWVYETRDFRYAAPETMTDAFGHSITMRLCEELIEGRWEPFYSVVRSEAANA